MSKHKHKGKHSKKKYQTLNREEDDLERYMKQYNPNSDLTGVGKEYTGQYTTYITDRHKPTKIIKEGKLEVWCGSESEVEDEVHKFTTIINLTGRSLFKPPEHVLPPELTQYIETEAPDGCQEWILDWDDYSDIGMKPEFWKALAEYLEKQGGKTLVFCMGGHGRTGTAMTCLLIATYDYTASEAVDFLRKKYCHKAVESKSQIEYVRKVGRFYHPTKQKEEDDKWDAWVKEQEKVEKELELKELLEKGKNSKKDEDHCPYCGTYLPHTKNEAEDCQAVLDYLGIKDVKPDMRPFDERHHSKNSSGGTGSVKVIYPVSGPPSGSGREFVECTPFREPSHYVRRDKAIWCQECRLFYCKGHDNYGQHNTPSSTCMYGFDGTGQVLQKYSDEIEYDL